jgi:alkylation response protein AidB-like acyl-CoA dehydrogenase
MSDFISPIDAINSHVAHTARVHGLLDLEAFSEVSEDLIEAVLDEAGKFADKVLAPINSLGDEQGVSCQDGKVTVPAEFGDAYRQLTENGWTSLNGDMDFGGQGMPLLLSSAVNELFSAANMAFNLCPGLSHGAVHAIDAHGSDELKNRYLQPLIEGTWTGTMCLTEPGAGSDLGRATTSAEPRGDHYLLRGRKIFITWGDHEMTDNIIHLVLARVTGAPEGSRGLSLFLVPKYLLGEDGSIGERNDVFPVSVEHKLGIHASPTCVLSFGDDQGATGYLVGEEGAGLPAMFTMMNNMRLDVAIQGASMCQRAYQHAVDFAMERVQGRVPGLGEVRIVDHSEVRRMLLTMRALTHASRALMLENAVALDLRNDSDDPDTRAAYQGYGDLLTPIAKGWCTEAGVEATSLSIQVHGGMGYVEETGVAQHFRDARIAPIYEGTNGIQAIDLVGRKLLKLGDAQMRSLTAGIKQLAAELPDDLSSASASLADGAELLEQATDWIIEHQADSPHVVGAVAFNYMMLAGTVTGGWLLARLAADTGDKAQVMTARFFMEQIMPRARAYAAAVQAGEGCMMEFPENQL